MVRRPQRWRCPRQVQRQTSPQVTRYNILFLLSSKAWHQPVALTTTHIPGVTIRIKNVEHHVFSPPVERQVVSSWLRRSAKIENRTFCNVAFLARDICVGRKRHARSEMSKCQCSCSVCRQRPPPGSCGDRAPPCVAKKKSPICPHVPFAFGDTILACVCQNQPFVLPPSIS